MNQVRKRLLFLFLVCSTIGTLNTGCSDEAAPESDNTILRPLAENVIGRWNEEMCRKNLDGKWEEDPMPEGQGQIYTIRKDGKVVSAHTSPDGYTKLKLGKWQADEAADKVTIGTMKVDVLGLDVDTFIMGYSEARDSETGELMNGEFRWSYARMDESQKTLAEQLVGKWNFSKSYEKKDGKWVEITYGVPDEGWHLYREDATFTAYSRSGENEITSDMNWTANTTTGEVRWIGKDGQASTMKVAIEADGTLSVFYANNVDPSTGQVISGEFKDVLVR